MTRSSKSTTGRVRMIRDAHAWSFKSPQTAPILFIIGHRPIVCSVFFIFLYENNQRARSQGKGGA